MEPHLLTTQYGFRKNHSTAQALFNVRRSADIGESTYLSTFLLFLDWEKAFDKIFHQSILIALERFQ
eukprot:2026277-Prorocentrum_lima.AAC.1